VPSAAAAAAVGAVEEIAPSYTLPWVVFLLPVVILVALVTVLLSMFGLTRQLFVVPGGLAIPRGNGGGGGGVIAARGWAAQQQQQQQHYLPTRRHFDNF
jgi:hypothetical protein